MGAFNGIFELENFDDLWNLGDPIEVEKAFCKILPSAKALNDKSVYLQLLSQIALAQALQKQFDTAHKTLDEAEQLLTPNQSLAHVRILLERGRVFQQSEKISEARAYFEKSFELSSQYKFYYHAINAAHMIAIVAQQNDEKITWNKHALNMAESTQDTRARLWLGPLYNNLGRNYLDAKHFDKALAAFEKALEYREKENYLPNIRFAQWAIARTLRALDRLDDALKIQKKLLQEYKTIAQSETFDMPVEMFTLTRGWVYEELAEIYNAKAKCFATLACDDLSNNTMFKKTEPERLERLRHIQNWE